MVLLPNGQTSKAEEEALKCQVRCVGCRRKRSALMLPRREFVPSSDPVKNKQRLVAREHFAKRCAHGKQRMNDAKIAIGRCEECNRPCTQETLLGFDFNHRDSNNKTCEISRLLKENDARFYAELPKCHLLCRGCHNVYSKKQWATKELTMKRHENRGKKRKRDETDLE